MKIINKKDGVSDEWFSEMASNINSMQEGFISNLKSKIREEKSVYSHNAVEQSSLDDSQDLEVMLKNIDDNTNEFIAKLLDGMEEIINSHNIKQ